MTSMKCNEVVVSLLPPLFSGTVFANICCKLIISQMSNTRSHNFATLHNCTHQNTHA